MKIEILVVIFIVIQAALISYGVLIVDSESSFLQFAGVFLLIVNPIGILLNIKTLLHLN